MANTDAAFGLKPVGNAYGGPFNGGVRRYYIPSTDTDTAVYIGSVVKLTGGADTFGVPVVTGNVSTADPVVGVVTSVEAITAESLQYRANSTSRYVYVADDPDCLFEVQADDDGSTLAATAVGGTCILVGFTSGSTVTGLSAVELDSSNLSETSDTNDDVRIIQFVQAPDNIAGETNGRWLVRLNIHQYVQSAVGV